MAIYAFPASGKTTVSKKYDNFIDLESYLFLLFVFFIFSSFFQKNIVTLKVLKHFFKKFFNKKIEKLKKLIKKHVKNMFLICQIGFFKETF